MLNVSFLSLSLSNVQLTPKELCPEMQILQVELGFPSSPSFISTTLKGVLTVLTWILGWPVGDADLQIISAHLVRRRSSP
jgi:hypothetical protein